MSQQQGRFRANRGTNAPGHIRVALVECFGYEVDPWFEALNNEENEVVFQPVDAETIIEKRSRLTRPRGAS
jgi:hypothetical protein